MAVALPSLEQGHPGALRAMAGGSKSRKMPRLKSLDNLSQTKVWCTGQALIMYSSWGLGVLSLCGAMVRSAQDQIPSGEGPEVNPTTTLIENRESRLETARSRSAPHLTPAGFSLRRRVNDLRANTRLSARATAAHRGSKPATPIVLVKKQGETDRKNTLQCNLLKRGILRTIFRGLT